MSDIGVYVHVPFCERVCPYCDFAVVAARTLPAQDEARYVDALIEELGQRCGAFADRRLASLYLGGGTPSLLTPDSLVRIVEAVRAAFEFEASPEITLEINPSTLERERLPGFRGAGVNRVSVGVQSFDDTILRRLGRAHRAIEGLRTLEACREAGFESLSLDLIFAAPDQTLAHLERDLDTALEFEPDHVSAYELTLEPGTPFGEAARRGRLKRPDEETVLTMMSRVESRLAQAGLARYEISSYARPGREAVHNRRYWERRPVLGLGMGAVSSDPANREHPFGVRRANPRQLEVYLDRVGRAEPPPSEGLDEPTARGEAVFLALRTARGLDPDAFAAEFGGPPRSFYAEAIDRLGAGGLLEEGTRGELRLTARGRDLSDSVFVHFVESAGKAG